MKILGVFSFIFGLGLLSIAGYGLYEESHDRTFLGSAIAVLILLTGIAILLFVVNTFSRTKIYGPAKVSEDILDLPDHILADEKLHGVSSFVIGCGIVSMVAGILSFLFSLYAGFDYLTLRITMEEDIFSIQLFVLIGIFFCSLIAVTYCIRKLFFSRK